MISCTSSLGNIKSATDVVLMHDTILSIPQKQQQYFIDKTVAITSLIFTNQTELHLAERIPRNMEG